MTRPTEQRESGIGFGRGLLVLIGVSLPLFFIGLGHPPLIEPDEPYYAVPALEMLRAGIWRVPLLHGAAWFDKPVFFYWSILAAFGAIGVSETAARLGSALAALGGLLVSSRFPGSFGLRSSWTGALILGTSLEYAILARAAVTDMTLTFFLTLGMAAVARYLMTERPVWAAVAGGAFGLATLTKGPAGLILPGAGLVLYLILSRRTVLVRIPGLAAGLAGLLLTAAPWYVYMAVAHRALLVDTFLGAGNVGRFFAPEHQQLPFFYVIVLFFGLLPWSSLIVPAFAAALGPSAWRAERARGAPPGPLFLLCWFTGVLAVFSVSASALLTYILPAFPPAALLLGAYTVRSLTGDTASRGLQISAAVGAVFALLVALLGIRGVIRGVWEVPPATVLIMAAILFAGAVCAWIAAMRRSLPAFLSCHAVSAAAMILLGVFTTGSYLDQFHSARTFVASLRRAGIADELAGGYRERGFGVDFYLGRTLPRAATLKALESHVEANPAKIWIVPGPDVRTVATDARLRVETVASTPSFAAMRLSPGTP